MRRKRSPADPTGRSRTAAGPSTQAPVSRPPRRDRTGTCPARREGRGRLHARRRRREPLAARYLAGARSGRTVERDAVEGHANKGQSAGHGCRVRWWEAACMAATGSVRRPARAGREPSRSPARRSSRLAAGLVASRRAAARVRARAPGVCERYACSSGRPATRADAPFPRAGWRARRALADRCGVPPLGRTKARRGCRLCRQLQKVLFLLQIFAAGAPTVGALAPFGRQSRLNGSLIVSRVGRRDTCTRHASAALGLC